MSASEAVASTDFEPGTLIDGRYSIKSFLGAGGFATVYRAHHVLIDRDVAVKVLDLKKGQDSKGFTERFFREAKIAAKIQHPNVVTIYDFGFAGPRKQPYIAMELLEGHDLSDELSRNGPLSPARALRLFRPALEALGEGHKAGIIHKDLKPANLYLTDPGGPREALRILDFGVARAEATDVARLTDTGQLLGTPRYLAPEYIRSQLVTPAIDVYQMALIMAEAISGQPAVDGAPYTVMMMHCNAELNIPELLRSGPIGEVFATALAVDHTERYANAADFLQALDGVSSLFTSEIAAPRIFSGAAGVVGPHTPSSPSPSPSVTGALAGTNRTTGPSASPLSVPLVAAPPSEGVRDHIDEWLARAGLPRDVFWPLLGTIVLILLTLLIALFSSLLGEGEEAAPGEVAGNAAKKEPVAEAPTEAKEPTTPDPAVTVEPESQTHVAEPVADPVEPATDPVEPATEPDPSDPVVVEPPTMSIMLRSDPSGAAVYVNSEEVGVTPLELDLSQGPLRFSIEKRGFKVYQATLDPASPPESGEFIARLSAEKKPDKDPSNGDKETKKPKDTYLVAP
ncbi:MAG: protein kinase [Myxococcota bacterium]|jgi:serine/threonine-protein kinase|nr:protein kinase [Myxococcota bacterium]